MLRGVASTRARAYGRDMTQRISFGRVGALACGVVVGTVLAAAPLGAHTGGGADSLTAGLGHPVGGPDHLLAMVAVGMLAVVGARLDRRFLWAAPLVFLAAMTTGGTGGLVGVASAPLELVIVGSVLALGAAIVVASRSGASRRAPLVLGAAVGLLAIAGLAHGHAHGVEAAAGTDAATYVAGFVVATLALHAIGGLVAGLVRSRPALVTSLGIATIGAGAALLV